MGRRGDHSFQELSDMIIDSAYEILERDGFEGISTRKIASKIGYTVGTLYNVFQNFDDIILHANGRTLERITNELSKKLKNKSGKENIKSLAKYYVDFSKKHNNIWSTLFEYKFDKKFKAPKWYQEKINKMFDVVQGALINELGMLPKEKQREIIIVIWSSIHGICVLSIKGKFDRTGVDSTALLVENFIANYMKGLGI